MLKFKYKFLEFEDEFEEIPIIFPDFYGLKIKFNYAL
jgi:hypothetical protein